MTSYRTTMREALGEVWGLEEKFSSSQIAQLKKAFEPMRGKKISTKNAEKLRGILDKVAGDKETLLALLKANIPFVSRGAATRLIDKHDMKGAEINKLMASYHVEEFEIDEGTKQVLAHGGKGQYKAVKDGDVTNIIHKGKVVGTADFDSGADGYFVSIKGKKGQEFFDDAQKMVDYFAKNKITEEVELDEAADMEASGKVVAKNMMMVKSMKPYASKVAKMKTVSGIDLERMLPHDKVSVKEIDGVMSKSMKEEVELDEAKYDLYHKDFSSAMQHAYKMAKKLHGITVDPKEIDDKVASGPKKPSEGKTNSYRLEGDKGAIQVQVYNKGGSKPYELNFYKEEVDLDEDIGALIFGGGIIAALLPVLFMAVREIIRGTPLESSIKKIVDKLKKNKNYKMSDSEKSDVKGFVSKVKKDKPSLLQKAMKQAKLNLLKDQREEVEEGAAADARRAMRNDPDMKQRSFSKDVSATDDDEKAASKNIMMQLRKAVSLRSYDVEFADGKKQKVDQKIAQAAQNKYNSFRKPADKEKFQTQIAKSYKDLLKTIKSGYGEQKESVLNRIDRKIKEKKNG